MVFFCCEKQKWDLNRERANLFAYSPLGEKTVQWTVLRVWSPQSENPIFSANKKDHLLMVFFCCEKQKWALDEVLRSGTEKHWERTSTERNPLARDGNPFVALPAGNCDKRVLFWLKIEIYVLVAEEVGAVCYVRFSAYASVVLRPKA